MPKRRKKPSSFLNLYYQCINESKITEEWKDIILGDKPMYQISNLGRVRNKKDGLIINPFHSYRKNRDGSFNYERPTYLRVQLYYYEDGIRKKKHFEISRLVAIHFIPIPEKYKPLTFNDLEVNHIKGGIYIFNNSVDNLEWCTTIENIHKAIKTGLRHPRFGDKHPSTFFNTHDVTQICECISKGMNAKETYDKIHLSVDISFEDFKHNFYNIKYKRSWRFISINYNF